MSGAHAEVMVTLGAIRDYPVARVVHATVKALTEVGKAARGLWQTGATALPSP